MPWYVQSHPFIHYLPGPQKRSMSSSAAAPTVARLDYWSDGHSIDTELTCPSSTLSSSFSHSNLLHINIHVLPMRILTLILFILWMSLVCPPPCGRGFETSTALEKHQASCRLYNNNNNSNELLKRLAERLAEKKARKRQRTEAAAEPEAGPSSLPAQDLVRSVSHIISPRLTVLQAVQDADMAVDSNTEISVTQAAPEHESELPRPLSPPQLGRGKRVKRKTWKLQEQLPQPPAPIIDIADVLDDDPPPSPPSPPSLFTTITRTAANIFGLYREYPQHTTHVSDDNLSLEDISYVADRAVDSDRLQTAPSMSSHSGTGPSTKPPYAPWDNWSIYRLMTWFSSGSKNKSYEDCDHLVHDVILSPEFNVADIPKNFDARREAAKLDADSEFAPDGWEECSVKIDVPDGKRHMPGSSDPPIPQFEVEGLLCRSITGIIKEVWSGAASRRFHFAPFRQFWRRASGLVERVYGELYSSSAFIKAHEEIQKLPREARCNLPRALCSIMFWSDSTQLANFGNAYLWPVYMFFGNQSKYDRARPNANACHHLAYVYPKSECQSSAPRHDLNLLYLASRFISNLVPSVDRHRTYAGASCPLPP